MKYVNNHPNRFDFKNTAYMLGFVQSTFSIIFFVFNSIILFTRANVYFTMISYVTVSIIVDMASFYYQVLSDDRGNALKEVFLEEHAPRVKNYNKENPFYKRPGCSNKCLRVLFKTSRLVFVGLIYYFVPFAYILVHQVAMLIKYINENADI